MQSSLSEEQHRWNLPVKRWNAEYQSPWGLLGALYTLSAFYFTILVLNYTPWMWYACRLKCILPGSDNKQFLLAHFFMGWGGEKGEVYFTGSLLGSISQWEQELKGRENKATGVGEDRWIALLSLVALKLSPKCYSKMGNGGGGHGRIKRRRWLHDQVLGCRGFSKYLLIFHCFKSPLLKAWTCNWHHQEILHSVSSVWF